MQFGNKLNNKQTYKERKKLGGTYFMCLYSNFSFIYLIIFFLDNYNKASMVLGTGFLCNE